MLLATCISVYGWKLFSNKLNNHFKYNVSNKIYSSIHAFVTFCFSTLKLCNLISTNTYLYIVPYTTSYALYDIYYVFNNNLKLKYQMALHHSIIIVTNVLLYYKYYDNPFLFNVYLINYLTEITTPSLNCSILMYEQNYDKKYTVFYKLSNKITLYLFFGFRICNGLYLVHSLYYSDYKYIFWGQVLLTGMNHYWFYKLLKIHLKNTTYNI